VTDSELLIECKAGLNIPDSVQAFDAVLLQKLKAVKNYMSNSGVAASIIDTPAGTGAVVMGVVDIWDINGGDAKFSPAFDLILKQLAFKSVGVEEDTNA
jgi:hypothetical protein